MHPFSRSTVGTSLMLSCLLFCSNQTFWPPVDRTHAPLEVHSSNDISSSAHFEQLMKPTSGADSLILLQNRETQMNLPKYVATVYLLFLSRSCCRCWCSMVWYVLQNSGLQKFELCTLDTCAPGFLISRSDNRFWATATTNLWIMRMYQSCTVYIVHKWPWHILAILYFHNPWGFARSVHRDCWCLPAPQVIMFPSPWIWEVKSMTGNGVYFNTINIIYAHVGGTYKAQSLPQVKQRTPGPWAFSSQDSFYSSKCMASGKEPNHLAGASAECGMSSRQDPMEPMYPMEP